MLLATLLLICTIPQSDDTAKAVADANAASERPSLPSLASDSASKKTIAAAFLPSAPKPKANVEPGPVAPRTASQSLSLVLVRPKETPRQRKIWYGLMVAGHSGAAFDAWSTYRAVSRGYGQEANPLLRPFVNSKAIYAATQVSPAFMDYLGKRMMVGRNEWIRKLWWFPQLAGASLSFVCGAHNVAVVH